MKYVQGHVHFDECPRAAAQYSPCSCDVLRLQKRVLAQASVPVEFKAILSPAEDAALASVAQEILSEELHSYSGEEVDELGEPILAEAPGEDPEVGF